MSDLISRQAAIDVADAVWCVTGDKNVAKVWDQIKDLPPVKPDDRLAKIAALVEGTIDHFDLDDAMDLLYQIKEVLK